MTDIIALAAAIAIKGFDCPDEGLGVLWTSLTAERL
jgi:hypothetical protein